MWTTVLMILLLMVGFVFLIKGADLFVDGACDLSAKLKIPPYIVGMTVVALGTSLPEAAVSITAAISGSNDIAIGNIVGSNMFNTLVVLGASAIMTPVAVNKFILKRDYPFCVMITALLLILLMPLAGRTLTRIDGIILLLFFAFFMVYSIRAGKNGASENDEEAGDADSSYLKIVLFIVIGVAAVIAGGQFTVKAAVCIADKIGMSETVIGLTVVAIGTSLPELVTSMVAAKKSRNDIAVGNVIGSNIFNILFILGASAAISGLKIDAYAVIDVAVLLGVMILSFILCATRKKINKAEGIAMIMFYIAYTAFLLVR